MSHEVFASTVERLRGYHDFSDEVLIKVGNVAVNQAQFGNYSEYLGSIGIDDLSPMPLLDIRPEDEDDTLVFNLPMANCLDANQVFQVATVASALPNTRVIAFGNPAGGSKYGFNLLTKEERAKVASGDFSPVSEIPNRYLYQNYIDRASHYGASYGVEPALASSIDSDHEIDNVILVEPASVVPRGLTELLKDFMASGSGFPYYVEKSGSKIFKEAVDSDATISQTMFALGIGRLSNIAVGRGIAKGRFFEKLDKAIQSADSNDIDFSVIWGSDSELAVDEVMQEELSEIVDRDLSGKLQVTRLEGQKHALMNDIYLQAALILQHKK
jgi:hypothetical protein